MSDAGSLAEIVARLEELRRRLEQPGTTAAQATELLEEISALAGRAAADLERRAEAAEGHRPP